MIGQTISHYKIVEKLGEGGMGVVYRAHDTMLDRPVALKFLPPDLSVTEQDKARFIQEAKAAAILSHPNICPIHAIEEHQGQLFIVMDYVDGQTLRSRKREFSVKEAVDVGIQIADGLGAAHEKGVVHRDIKPENIMMRKGGIVQIMDFGLAKMRGSSSVTKTGTVVGTPGYMSPEQVQGQDLDHRSDIFSFGVVMYEIVTGQLPFKGAHEAAMLYEIVNVEAAPMSSIKPDIDRELDRIVLECMQKDPDERYHSAKDISRDLKRFKRESSRTVAASAITAPQQGVEPPHSPKRRSTQFAWSLVALLSIAGIFVLGWYLLRSTERKNPIRSFLLPPDSVGLYSGRGADPVVISPDGRQVAYVGITSPRQKILYVQALDATAARQLPGTEGAQLPFWSPDNEFIGFFSGTKLKKVSTKGGSPVTIVDYCAGPRGANWGKDGTVLYAPYTLTSLFAIREGGTPVQQTQLDSTRAENSHRWPWFLPDGKHFFYYARTANAGGDAEGDAIYIASLDRKLNRRLLNTSGNAAFADGYLLYTSKATLMAQRFDEGDLALKGEAVPIADDVLYDVNYGLGTFSVSNTGILVYQTGGEVGNARLFILDRSGKEVGKIGEAVQHNNPRLSYDGKFVAVSIYDAKSHNQNIWIYDLNRGSKTRLTSGMSFEIYPVWSPDGSRLIYTRHGGGNYEFYQKSRGGIDNEVMLHQFREPGNASDWSGDAKYVLFDMLSGSPSKWGIWVLQLEGQQKVFRFLGSQFNQQGGRFSPDGKWVSYMSDETGGSEVYIRPFPGPGQAIRVSPGGGRMARWSRNGNELCYIDKSYNLMTVEIKVKGSTMDTGNPRILFKVPMSFEFFDCTSDGNRFVLNRPSETSTSARIRIVQNWDADLRK